MGDFDTHDVPPLGSSSPSPHRDFSENPSLGLQGLQGLSGTRVIGAAGAPRLHHYGPSDGHTNNLRLGEIPPSLRLGDIYSSYQTPAVLDEQHFSGGGKGSMTYSSDGNSYGNGKNNSSNNHNQKNTNNRHQHNDMINSAPQYAAGSYYESTSAFYGTTADATQGRLHQGDSSPVNPLLNTKNVDRNNQINSHNVTR